jgi:hypothetical protein
MVHNRQATLWLYIGPIIAAIGNKRTPQGCKNAFHLFPIPQPLRRQKTRNMKDPNTHKSIYRQHFQTGLK